MKRVVSVEEMKWCDESAIKKFGIPAKLLMESAGLNTAEIIRQEFSPLESKNILIFCGKGNNGGDGFVAARALINSCARISVVMLASPSELKGDTKYNFKILQVLAKKSKKQITGETAHRHQRNYFTHHSLGER